MHAQATMPFLLFLLAAPLAHAADQSAPLKPRGQCLIERDVRNWAVVDDRRLVVETDGKRFFDISLTNACRRLPESPYIAFRTSSELAGIGAGQTLARHMGGGGGPDRVCGEIGDAVVPLGRTLSPTPCDIQRIRRISGETFDGVVGKSSAQANALLDAVVDLHP